MAGPQDHFSAISTLSTQAGDFRYFGLEALETAGVGSVSELPFVIKVLLEAALRRCDGETITPDHVVSLAGWKTEDQGELEIPFSPSRVILQDFTGVPSVVDLAALRSAMARMGGDPKRINPQVPVDLVIDHSVQVDHFGSSDALALNTTREFERNLERYEFLRWGQLALEDFQVVPPSSGIVHQVNLEFLANVVQARNGFLFPDSLVGTDSHTTMINGLGVLGWGVGGIEAEAALLGQPIFMLMPKVVGVKLTGELAPGVTATDLVLTVVEVLRNHGVVGKLVEFHGPGLDRLTLADRATLANMAPEYGATTGFFPVDDETLVYLASTGRSPEVVDRVERYCKAQGLYRLPDSPTPRYSEHVHLDLSDVEPCISGPKRPQDRIGLSQARQTFQRDLQSVFGVDPSANASQPIDVGGVEGDVTHGSIGIAAITSCTNTSNPSVLVAAGLVAQKAVERGLSVQPWVKTSLAPGSKAVTRYLEKADLISPLQALGFHVVGYGCTTCIGNSGPIVPQMEKAVGDGDLVLTSVLSGNRNFEGRISPHVKANYLASPPLVVAYALAGTVDKDLTTEPLGEGTDGPVYLSEIWPSNEEVGEVVSACLDASLFTEEYGKIFDANAAWNAIESNGGELFEWKEDSTYVREPSFFVGLGLEPDPVTSISGARVLALLGDSVTTDHISPAGAIPADSPAADYLRSHGIEERDFNSFGSRRGNHEVMMRGTFGNIRLRNQLAPGTEGGWTRDLDTDEVVSIYEGAMRYADRGTPLVVLTGVDYGMGSSRDWAAKGTFLLGVKAVIAASYERIHRSNLLMMGVLPLQFAAGDTWQSLGLTGEESFDIPLTESIQAGQSLEVTARSLDGGVKTFAVEVRLDTPVDVRYWKNGGILHTVLRELAQS